MCIRDRLQALRLLRQFAADVAEADDAQRLPFDPPKLGARLQDIPCLLYTSDAADDLLCVDLGGRRIIKKKK